MFHSIPKNLPNYFKVWWDVIIEFDFVNYRVKGPESDQKVEIEVLANAQGVVDFIETLNSLYPINQKVLSTLRIHEMDKVSALN